MSRRPNPTIIGVFVLGAIGLVVAGIAIFGSGKFLSHHPRAVAFFQGDIQGLSVGSAVTLRGVQVGSVSDIQLRLDVETMQPSIPVYVEFDPSRFKEIGTVNEADIREQRALKTAIAHGLHARLVSQSLVTGQVLVELDLDPNEPRRLVGADPSTVEIPTSQSDMEKLKQTLTRLPLDRIANLAVEVMQNANRILSSNDIPKLLGALVSASHNLDLLLGDARGDLPPLVGDLRDTFHTARETLGSAQGALTQMQTVLSRADNLLATDGREAVRTAVSALQRADKTLASTDSLLAANSPQRYDIDQMLRNLAAASRSLRLFAEDLERRPNAIVMGK